jgi:hypothetical protein
MRGALVGLTGVIAISCAVSGAQESIWRSRYDLKKNVENQVVLEKARTVAQAALAQLSNGEGFGNKCKRMEVLWIDDRTMKAILSMSINRPIFAEWVKDSARKQEQVVVSYEVSIVEDGKVSTKSVSRQRISITESYDHGRCERLEVMKVLHADLGR